MNKEKVVYGFKAFDKDMKCRGFQYEVGKTYKHNGEISPCNSGFHFCENPLDVLDFYDLCDSSFAKIAATGKVIKDGNKSVTGDINISASLSLPEFIKEAIEYITAACKTDKSIQSSSGDGAQLASSGYKAQLASSGDGAKLASSGDGAQLASSGYKAQLASSGDGAQLASSGYKAKLASSGDGAQLASSGDWAQLEIKGQKSIGANIGINGIIKAALGSWITLAEYNDEYEPIMVKSAKVDGNKIKADTWYKLEGGKFVELK